MRDQLTLAMRWNDGLADNSGSVDYEYCLTCDSAMSRRFVYAGGSGTTQGDLLQGQQFVYDGLTLYRADQIYDDDSNGLSDTDEWRVWWENTTMPALLGGHLAKRVYSYPSGTSGTSNGSTDYYYAYDAIGNVIAISDSAGARQYHFAQDAFGNELTQDSFGGDSWDTARDDGIWEHQTGKWMDEETGLYFFHARWVDPVVGRFVGRTVLPRNREGAYEFCSNRPTMLADPTGWNAEGAAAWTLVLCMLDCWITTTNDPDKMSECLKKNCTKFGYGGGNFGPINPDDLFSDERECPIEDNGGKINGPQKDYTIRHVLQALGTPCRLFFIVVPVYIVYDVSGFMDPRPTTCDPRRT